MLNGAVALLLVACGDSTFGLGVEPEIRNLTDNFEFQVSNLDNLSNVVIYTWHNTGTVANVNQSATVTDGSARLEILDAAGALVYARSLTDNGTFVTDPGQTGSWTIRVVLTEADGTLNFRVQKRP
jgi:hypothetical protein